MKLRMYRVRAAAKAPPAKGHRSLPPLVCHPGGKRHSLHQILPRIPEHRVYVEPFFGGGSVFFSKPPAEKSVVNDLDKGLMGFYRKLDCRRLRRCIQDLVAVGTNPEKIRPHWKRRASKAEKGSSDTCDVWIGKTYGYGCKSGRGSFSPASAAQHKGVKKALANCDRYKERLRRTVILSGDYQAVMRKYDSRSTFFYLDPPWLGAERNGAANASFYRGKDTTSPEAICSFLRRVKGMFLLHYDNSARIRRACKALDHRPLANDDGEGRRIATKISASHQQLRTAKQEVVMRLRLSLSPRPSPRTAVAAVRRRLGAVPSEAVSLFISDSEKLVAGFDRQMKERAKVARDSVDDYLRTGYPSDLRQATSSIEDAHRLGAQREVLADALMRLKSMLAFEK